MLIFAPVALAAVAGIVAVIPRTRDVAGGLVAATTFVAVTLGFFYAMA